jgi:hypothetical protein
MFCSLDKIRTFIPQGKKKVNFVMINVVNVNYPKT